MNIQRRQNVSVVEIIKKKFFSNLTPNEKQELIDKLTQKKIPFPEVKPQIIKDPHVRLQDEVPKIREGKYAKREYI